MPESIIKALERYLTPQLNEIKGELKAINTRFDATNSRIDSLRNELKSDIARLDEKMDIKIFNFAIENI